MIALPMSRSIGFTGTTLEVSLKVLVRRYRSQSIALLSAAVLALLALTVDMTWKAEATAVASTTTAGTVDESAPIDVDSLYDAIVAIDEEIDSEPILAVPSTPEREITGHISWYGPGFHGRLTANGERYNMNGMTAAHKKLPFNTIVRVIDDVTGAAILVRINDRGPYIRGRVLDLSKAAATRLGMRGRGTTSGLLEIYPEYAVDERITAVSEGEGEKKDLVRYQTYDLDARGVRPNGWSVSVADYSDFESAVNTFDRLRGEYDAVFLSRVRNGKKNSWRVTVGLYGSRHMAENLSLELADSYEEVTIITFENGFPVVPTTRSSSADV